MSKKTIAKISAFVILVGLWCVSTGCSPSFQTQSRVNTGSASAYGEPKITGKIELKDITESSGIAASKCQPGIFWTHNDSGDDAFIFAIDEKGDNLGTWRVQNSENIDWEDIAEFLDASGKCFIYIGEIGDNKIQRPVHAVYRVAEPVVTENSKGTDTKDALSTEPAAIMKFSYPDHNQNAETMMVNPESGDIYVLTKRLDGPSGIYKLKPTFGDETVRSADKIGELSVPSVPNGYLTGGDIAPDGKRLVVCDYNAAYELIRPPGSTNFDDIWRQPPVTIDRGKLEQGEAIGYTADGNSLILTSEKKHSPVVIIARK